MKDEELADKYAEEYFCKPTELVELWKVKSYKDAFLAGLKLGRPQWHDLRKDPQDLPKGHKVVLNQVGMATQYDPNRGFLGFGGAGIIAWCETPIFDKE